MGMALKGLLHCSKLKQIHNFVLIMSTHKILLSLYTHLLEKCYSMFTVALFAWSVQKVFLL